MFSPIPFLAAFGLLLSVPLLGQTIFDQNSAGSTIYTISGGSFDQETGAFVRSGTDSRQGIVASFSTVSLDQPGDFIQATFNYSNSSASNGIRQTFGFFSGDPVTANAQTSVTDGWTGYFNGFNSRAGTGTSATGIGFQGEGSNSLFNHASGELSSADFDGFWGGIGNQFGFDNSAVTLRLERIDADTMRLTTVWSNSGTRNTSGSLSSGDITWSQVVADGTAVFTSNYQISAFNATQISGIGISNAGNFNLSNLEIVAIPEMNTMVLVGVVVIGFFFLRKNRREK